MKTVYTVSLTATFALLAVGSQAYSSSATANQTSTTRPNVLVILTDDQDVESLAGMPKLMSFPEGSWVNFTNAFVNTSLCAPARAALLTGQYAEHHGVVSNVHGRSLAEHNLLPVWLDEAGYTTALIGKYHLRTGAKYRPLGWDDRVFAKGRDGDVDAYTQAAINYIQTHTSPWFVLLSYDAPHPMANPPERYQRTPINLPPPRPNVNELDVSDKPMWLQSYPLLKESTLGKWHRVREDAWRETLAIDDGIASIVASLKANGQLENTLIIFLADNGVSWGSHRKIGKWCPYEECSHIPLLIRYPGATRNRVETRFVSNVDVATTIADYTGVEPMRPQDGRSLLPLLDDTARTWRNSVFLERHINDNYFGVRVPGWKYLEYEGGYRELYDLTADPYEMQNVAGQPAYSQIQAQLAHDLHLLINVWSINGTIMTDDGEPVRGVRVIAGEGLEATTRSMGNYTFTDLPPGTYTITPRRLGYDFEPAQLTITLGSNDLIGQDFTAIPRTRH